jgi:hypothetical protein
MSGIWHALSIYLSFSLTKGDKKSKKICIIRNEKEKKDTQLIHLEKRAGAP